MSQANSDTHLGSDEKPGAVELTGSTGSRQPLKLIIVAAASTVVVLGLALGLGLGLGLKHHHSSSATSGSSDGTGSLEIVSTPDANAAFMSASLVNDAPTTRTYDFVVEERRGAPDGVEKLMLVVNGQFPGPTIEANTGDRIVVNVTNKLSNSTTVHWHGLYQRGTNYYDGTESITQCGIPPDESMVYNFTLDGWMGSTWWHAHSMTQYTDGVVGALVVHAKNESVPSYDGDIVLQLSDLYHTFSPVLLNLYFTPGGLEGGPGNEPVPDGGVINGVGQYGDSANTPQAAFWNATLESNKTYRLRLVNTGSFVAMQFSVDNHTLTVIEADGTAVKPFEVSSVSVAVAQRYSVLLRTNQSAGAYWIRAGLDQSALTYDNPGAQMEIRGVVRYGVANSTMPDFGLLDNPPSLPAGSPQDLDTGALVPVVGGPAPDATFQVYLTISMQYASSTGNGNLSKFLSFINSTSWEPLQGTSSLFSHLGNNTSDGSATFADSQLITTVNEQHIVQMVIDNLDDGDHPFHLHGQKFWIVAQGDGRFEGPSTIANNTTPMIRDTLVIPAYTYAVLRFSADNPGFWAFHCHIQWHMAAGLLFQLNVLPSESAKFDIPQYMLEQCKWSASTS